MIGNAKCPHCGFVNRNRNPYNTFARCCGCYQYFDVEKAVIEGEQDTEQQDLENKIGPEVPRLK